MGVFNYTTVTTLKLAFLTLYMIVKTNPIFQVIRHEEILALYLSMCTCDILVYYVVYVTLNLNSYRTVVCTR